MASLQDKTLIMLVGPSAVGKSKLMNEVVRQSSDFGRITGFTTRAPRPDDEPGQYRYYSKDDVRQKNTAGKLTQYVEFPTTGHFYGTEPHDYPAKYNLKDTLANAVDDYRRLPFERIITVSLTAPVEQWQMWFLSRYPHPSDEALQRLEEARLSIQWSLSDPQTHWINNVDGHISDVATRLIELATSRPAHYDAPPHPHAILELIKGGLWPKK